MSSPWSFHNPVRVEFGAGCVGPALARIAQRRLLLVTSPGMTRRGRTAWLQAACAGRIVGVFDEVAPNPKLVALDALAAKYRTDDFDGVLALGGGSALDTGKVLAVLLGGSVSFSLSGHFLSGQPLPKERPLPVIAIPTTSGTGSEVTPFATVWDDRTFKKYSLAHGSMFPLQAMVDPELTHDLPWDVILSTAWDALCQACEAIWNRHANPVTLLYALRAAELAWRALQRGEGLTKSPVARAELAEASLLAGMAISHTRTSICHSISYPITARYGLPHGLACAFTMPAVLRYNAVTDDGRLLDLARRLDCNSCEHLAGRLSDLLRQLGVYQRVAAAVPVLDDLLALGPEMITPNRANNNLRAVGEEALAEILRQTQSEMGK